MLQIDRLLKEPLIQLFNGENNDCTVKALLRKIAVGLDQPFTGLDTAGRVVKNINKLAQKE